MNEVLESQKGSAEIREKQLKIEFDAKEQELQRAYAEKEKMLEKQLENYKKAQEAELAKQKSSMEQRVADCSKEIENKQAEIDLLGQELTRMMDSLRESEAKREEQRRSSELREKEHEKTVKRLYDMMDSVRKIGEASRFAQEKEADSYAPPQGGARNYAPQGYAPDDAAGRYAPQSYTQDDAPGRYAPQSYTQDDAAGRYAPQGYTQDDAAGRYAPQGGAGGYAAQGYAPSGRAGGYPGEDSAVVSAMDSVADEYGWVDDAAGSQAGGVIRRGAVNEQSRKPFAGDGMRPERAGYAGGSAGSAGRAGGSAGASSGAGSMNRAGSSAGNASRSGALRFNGAADNTGAGSAAEQTPPRSSVMDDLVQMASADDGVLREELFSIDECMENIMMLQEPVCAKKRIHLEYKKSVSMPPQAIGDKSKLQRALVSLLESVAEQTSSGSVITLGCRADKASRNRAYLYFTIRDDSSSLAGELMQGMFEMKDERDDPLRAGLYIAREIISTMGGNVRVRSRRGEGTEFMVMVCMRLP